jgi:GNAT superfamily N-acetyltransferase
MFVQTTGWWHGVSRCSPTGSGSRAVTCDDVDVPVRPVTAKDLGECQAIVRGLPDYFTTDVPEKISRDARLHGGWVITEDEAVAGFAIVERRFTGAAEVLWMAVRADRRRRGLGSTLLNHVLQALHCDGVKLVQAKTLDASAGYEPYVATRAFWQRHGFVQVDVIDPLPGWPPGNPAAIYLCALGSTR